MARASSPSVSRAGNVPFPERRIAECRRALLEWFERSARDLPWRRDRTPWRVWVSEIMLQQTRVEAVVEPFERFMRAFPTLESMASSGEADVLAHWSGLGYYRRARLLHAGALAVMDRHAGEIPHAPGELERIPGIGRYTAGAIAAIAFGERAAALDSNVTRVVARLAGIADPRTGAGRVAVERVATGLVDCPRAGDVNEALMDLGSAACTAKTARCGECPVSKWCTATSSGAPLAFAPPRVRKAPRMVRLASVVVSDGERVLFVRRPAGDALLGGLWDLPTVELDTDAASGSGARKLARIVRDQARLDVRVGDACLSVRHEIVGRRIVADVHVATLRGPVADGLHGCARLLDEAGRREVGMPALPVKILRALAASSQA
jgi:A/G-specific adenine glycosylase